MTTKRRALAALALFAFSGSVLAGGKHEQTKPPEPVTPPAAIAGSIAAAGAESSAEAAARARSASESDADARADQRQRQSQDASSSASNGGNSFSTSTSVRALDLPGHAGAPVVVTDCHESRGSLGAVGIGSGGRVKLNARCVEQLQCMERADRFERYGLLELAARELASCSNVDLPADWSPPTARHDPPPLDERYATKEELRRAFESSLGKGVAVTRRE